jgi:hypothetical protein
MMAEIPSLSYPYPYPFPFPFPFPMRRAEGCPKAVNSSTISAMAEAKRDLPRPTPILANEADLSLLRYMLGLSPLERLAVIEKSGTPRLLRIAEAFAKHQVESLVIGGAAAILWGAPLATGEVEFCYRQTPENLRRLAAALAELHSSPRDAPGDLQFRLDAESLALGARFELTTDFGPLDLCLTVDPRGDHDRLLPRSTEMDVGSVRLRVIGLEDLLRTLIPPASPQARQAHSQLAAIHQLLSERGPDRPVP